MPLSAAAATSGAMLAGLSPISNSMRMSLPWAAWAALRAPAKPELAT